MSQALRNRYVSNAVETVSPARLITMLYDSMVKDLHIAEEALGVRDLAKVNERLCHAQEIVLELQSSLDASKWEAGQQLAGLYDYLLDQLVAANVKKDPALISKCRDLVLPLQEAWHSVADNAAALTAEGASDAS